jgi:hypothetical protein
MVKNLTIEHNLTNDDTRDISIKIVDELVANGLVENCIDTDDETEFEFQDIIHNILNEIFNLKEG